MNNPYGYIYCLKLLKDGRIYIGQTIDDPYVYYKREYVNRKGKGRILLNRAILKYGIESFKFTVLSTEYNKKSLDAKEIYYIDFYESRKNDKGFNLRTGGSRGKHSKKSIKKMRGIKRPNALIVTLRNVKTGKEITGCVSVLARRYNFHASGILREGKSRGWKVVSIKDKLGNIRALPKFPPDKSACRGIFAYNAKIATIRNIKTGDEFTGCLTTLAKTYNFEQRNMASRGKSKEWVLIKLCDKKGNPCKFHSPPINKDEYHGMNVSQAKITTIKNKITGEVVVGCMKELAKKYNFSVSQMNRRKISNNWILISKKPKQKYKKHKNDN